MTTARQKQEEEDGSVAVLPPCRAATMPFQLTSANHLPAEAPPFPPRQRPPSSFVLPPISASSSPVCWPCKNHALRCSARSCRFQVGGRALSTCPCHRCPLGITSRQSAAHTSGLALPACCLRAESDELNRKLLKRVPRFRLIVLTTGSAASCITNGTRPLPT